MLFIYGTLKRGKSRAHFLAGQRFLRNVRTAEKYRMVDCGGYPGLVTSENGLAIEGELWEVDAECLPKLDKVEAVAENLYRPDRVELQPPHEQAKIITYLYMQSVEGFPDSGVCW